MTIEKDKKTERDFFSGEYSFTGKHGKFVKDLTSSLVEKTTYRKDIKIFENNYKIYIVAPMVGFLYKEKAVKEYSEKVAKISEGQIIRYADRAQEVMKLILLLDKEYEADEQKRIDKAFRCFCEDENDFRLFEAYMRGGIEVMHEKIIGEEVDPFKITERLVEFLKEFQEMFNDKVKDNEIFELCEAFKRSKSKKKNKIESLNEF